MTKKDRLAEAAKRRKEQELRKQMEQEAREAKGEKKVLER